MKALKEKRLSLRSFLRRGLVILSLFALAFAFASCSDTSSGGGTTDTTPPPTNPPSVISITVSGRAGVETWFQGCAPDPKGLTIKALWADGPNAGQIIEYTHDQFATNGFSISPNFCDEPGFYPVPGEFRVVHKSSDVYSQAIDYEGVIPILGVTGGTLDKLYADQNPLMALIGQSIKLNYMWNTVVSRPSNNAKQSGPYVLTPITVTPNVTQYADRTIYINSAYPLWDLRDAAANSKVNVYFGKIKNTAAALHAGTITVKDYMQVVDIQVATPLDPDFFVYDDDIQFAVKTAGLASAMPSDLDKLLEKISFKVTYQKGKAGAGSTNEPEVGKIITWKEFKDNVAFARSSLSGAVQGPSGGDNIPDTTLINWGNDGKEDAKREAKYGWPEAEILIIDDEDTTWKIWLEYVPREYLINISGVPTGGAYVARVPVRIPVATFQNEITVKSRFGLSQALLPYQSAVGPMNENWMNVIKDMWVLTGQYNLGSRKLEPKVIKWASSLLTYGYHSGGTNINLVAKTLSDRWPSEYMSWASYSVKTERDFALPIYFRGETATEDDTVLVEIFRKSGQPNPSTW